jgi:hypothetical protein
MKYFMFDWLIYRLFVLNTSLETWLFEIMIFIYVCSAWSIVELKTRFEPWIKRNDVNGVSLFHLSYLITLIVYLCSQWNPNVQIKYFMCDWSIYRIFVLHTSLESWLIQIMVFVYVCSTCRVVELKTRFGTWITRNDVNGVSLFYLLYLITLMAYLCSQCTPNIQIKYLSSIEICTDYLC